MKETAKGNAFTLDMTATQASDKQAGAGRVEISGMARGLRDLEVRGSTMTLKSTRK